MKIGELQARGRREVVAEVDPEARAVRKVDIASLDRLIRQPVDERVGELNVGDTLAEMRTKQQVLGPAEEGAGWRVPVHTRQRRRRLHCPPVTHHDRLRRGWL